MSLRSPLRLALDALRRLRPPRWVGEVVLDTLFPPFCRECDARLARRGALCEDCARDIEWIGSACATCSMPVLNPSDHCAECRGRRLGFDRVLAAGVYGGPLKRLVLLSKRHGDREAERLLADVLEALWQCRAAPALAAADAPPRRSAVHDIVLVPVPPHPWKAVLGRRDHLAELARDLARRIDVPLETRLLVRRRWTRPQVGLERTRRLKNQRRAFGVRARRGRLSSAPSRLRSPLPSTVVLVDDVVTTCATASEAARALKRAGVRRVWVLAVARSPG